jgi:phosphoadenosine phosphosulfate reductase
MPLDKPLIEAAPELEAKVARLNAATFRHSAVEVLRPAREEIDGLAMVSSFGAESVALLHLVSVVDRNMPVLFIDTRMLFAETLEYQRRVSQHLGLRQVRVIRATDIAELDPDDTLHQRDTDACCALRKTVPLQEALKGYGGWITGRKRFQSGSRSSLAHFEVETPDGAPQRIKVNPLAYWKPGDVQEYMTENRLPRHPLVKQGYPSIGCAPCTSPVAPGEDPRAGRWRDQNKEECGIHFVDGKMVRTRSTT